LKAPGRRCIELGPFDEDDQQAMLFDDRNDVLHASPASLARYVVTIIRGMAIWARSLTKLIADHRKATL
jgi:hypothetical protein